MADAAQVAPSPSAAGGVPRAQKPRQGSPDRRPVGAMETFCLGGDGAPEAQRASSGGSSSVLQQQNARRCFAVVPPWAVHVPLKEGSRAGGPRERPGGQR